MNINVVVSAHGFGGASGGGFAFVPGFTITARSGSQIAIDVPGFDITSNVTTGTVAGATFFTPRIDVTGSGTAGAVATTTITVPQLQFLWGIGTAQVPHIDIDAFGDSVAAIVRKVIAMNLSNGAVSEYTNYPFDFLVSFKGRRFGCGAGGIYLLEGDKDVSSEIDGSIELPPSDLGDTSLKRVPYVYVGCRKETFEKLCVGVNPDETRYRENTTTRVGRNRRAQMPKGIKGRYWGVRVSNIDGCDMQIDNVEIMADVLERRI